MITNAYSKQSDFASENIAPMGEQQGGQCICSRPKSKVICQRCGYFAEQCRARRSCPTHPKLINLMDLSECPKCRSKYPDLHETGSSTWVYDGYQRAKFQVLIRYVMGSEIFSFFWLVKFIICPNFRISHFDSASNVFHMQFLPWNFSRLLCLSLAVGVIW